MFPEVTRRHNRIWKDIQWENFPVHHIVSMILTNQVFIPLDLKNKLDLKEGEQILNLQDMISANADRPFLTPTIVHNLYTILEHFNIRDVSLLPDISSPPYYFGINDSDGKEQLYFIPMNKVHNETHPINNQDIQ